MEQIAEIKAVRSYQLDNGQKEAQEALYSLNETIIRLKEAQEKVDRFYASRRETSYIGTIIRHLENDRELLADRFML